MTAVDYTEILRRRWRLIVLVAICTTFAAAAVGPRLAGDQSEESNSYRATSTLLVRGNLDYTLQQLALLASDGVVPRSAAAEVGEGGVQASVYSVSTGIDVDGEILTIQVEGSDAQRAEALSAAVAEELIAFVGAEREAAARAAEAAASARLQELAVQIEVMDERIAADPDDSLLRAQRQGLVAAYTSELRAPDVAPSAGSITVLDSPTTVALANDSLADVSGTLPRRLTLGIVLGSLLAVGVALVVDRFDTRLRDRKSVEETTGVPVLIELPLTDDARARRSAAGLVFGPHHYGPLAERFRRLRSALVLLGDRDSSGPRGTDLVRNRKLGVLVCSPGPSAVRSTTAANLAAAFAESGRSVILVTQRMPGSCADLLVVESHGDVPGALTTDIDGLHESLLSTEVAGLQLLDLRPLTFERGQFGKLLARLDDAADVVIYDVPPLLINADAMEFLPFGSIAVLVVRAGSTRSAAISRAAELLRLGRVPMVVSVLVGRRRHRRLGTRPASPQPPVLPVSAAPKGGPGVGPELSGPASPGGQPASGESDDDARDAEDCFDFSDEPDGHESVAPASLRLSIGGVEPAVVAFPSSVPSETR